MSDHLTTPEDATRIRRHKAALIALLTRYGVTGARVAVTPGHTGRPAAWASVPQDEAAHLDIAALTAAGYTVRPGVHTVSITMGEAA